MLWFHRESFTTINVWAVMNAFNSRFWVSGGDPGLPDVCEHLSWATIFVWPAGWSLYTGFTVYVYIYMHISMYLEMYVCVHAFTCIHTCINVYCFVLVWLASQVERVVKCSPHCQNGLCCIPYMLVVDYNKDFEFSKFSSRGIGWIRFSNTQILTIYLLICRTIHLPNLIE